MIRRFSQLSSIDGLCDFLSLLKIDSLRAVTNNEKVLRTFREESSKLLPAEIVLHWESYNIFVADQLEKNGREMSFLFVSLSKMISSFPFEVDRDVARKLKGKLPTPWTYVLFYGASNCGVFICEDSTPDSTREIIEDVEKAVVSSLKRLGKIPTSRRSKNITKLLYSGSSRVKQMMQNEPLAWTELPPTASPDNEDLDLEVLPEDEWKDLVKSKEAWKDLKILIDDWTQKLSGWLQNGEMSNVLNKTIICPSNVNHANPEFSVDKKFVFLWDRIRGEKEVIFRKIFDKIFFLLNSEECQQCF
eukprot:GHVP01025297.1.p1 GENE.GHVP01025297.1~~GHVP01025297.1.p1  ORF type:complete len:303 (+),score=57.79 GHVP01025297.1:893-1801(+)